MWLCLTRNSTSPSASRYELFWNVRQLSRKYVWVSKCRNFFIQNYFSFILKGPDFKFPFQRGHRQRFKRSKYSNKTSGLWCQLIDQRHRRSDLVSLKQYEIGRSYSKTFKLQSVTKMLRHLEQKVSTPTSSDGQERKNQELPFFPYSMFFIEVFYMTLLSYQHCK